MRGREGAASAGSECSSVARGGTSGGAQGARPTGSFRLGTPWDGRLTRDVKEDLSTLHQQAHGSLPAPRLGALPLPATTVPTPRPPAPALCPHAHAPPTTGMYLFETPNFTAVWVEGLEVRQAGRRGAARGARAPGQSACRAPGPHPPTQKHYP